MQIKQDTYATIRVVSAEGEDLLMVDGGGSRVTDGLGQTMKYSNFILQSVQEARIEKQQIIETFGDDYVFFFGEKPRIVTFSGVLVNSADFNWKNEWWKNYDELFRGTRLVEENARLYIYYDDVVASGYVMSSQTQLESGSPHVVPFSFQLFVTDQVDISNVGSVLFQNYTTGVPPEPASFSGVSSAADQAVKEKTLRDAIGSTGGLNAFLAKARGLANNADFRTQQILEDVRNTLFGRSIVYPQDLSTAVLVPPITNQATFGTPKTNRPINENFDEYVAREPVNPAYDQAEIDRVQKELALRSPAELDRRARADLAQMGIDTTRRPVSMLLLGRAAFAGAQYIGSFGIRQADSAVQNGLSGLVT